MKHAETTEYDMYLQLKERYEDIKYEEVNVIHNSKTYTSIAKNSLNSRK